MAFLSKQLPEEPDLASPPDKKDPPSVYKEKTNCQCHQNIDKQQHCWHVILHSTQSFCQMKIPKQGLGILPL